MRVLQFSLAGEAEQRPEAYEEDVVAYTGTHDNNTMRAGSKPRPVLTTTPKPGRPSASGPRLRLAVRRRPAVGLGGGHLGHEGRLAIAPVQDLLGLGAEHRMNTPGTVEQNWLFRLDPGALSAELAGRLRSLTEAQRRS